MPQCSKRESPLPRKEDKLPKDDKPKTQIVSNPFGAAHENRERSKTPQPERPQKEEEGRKSRFKT
jgi:hypothetical protein